MNVEKIEQAIVRKTEGLLGALKRRSLRKKARQKRLPPVVDWLISIFIIILFVILINMFLFQNYRIPSGSMVPELLDGDLIFVEKVSFGPEILPGVAKLPALRAPARGEVVSFESDVYALSGPFLELVYRFVYFITLSAVNLKTDANNQPLKDLLIKRVIGLGGDRVREFRGRLEILPACETEWQSEKPLVTEGGVSYTTNTGGFPRGVSFFRRELADLSGFLRDMPDRWRFGGRTQYVQEITDRTGYERDPTDSYQCSAWHGCEQGWYVPKDMFFPMGDNRTYSRDARYFGPVGLAHIQGKALFRFFPFSRFGAIE